MCLDNVFGILAVNVQLMQPGNMSRNKGAKQVKKHYGRLTAEIVAYLKIKILVAVSKYYNFW
jgi:hypothetical protein